MRVWLDNTGVQSAALCLSGQGRSESDIKSLLQLATLIAFSDSLLVNGFEVPEVARRTAEISHNLAALGLDESAFCIQAETEDSFAAACAEAADGAAEDLPYVFRPAEPTAGDVLPPLLSPAMRATQAAFPDALAAEPSGQVLRELRVEALGRKSAGAVQIMLAESAELRRAVREVRSAFSPFSESCAEQLSGALRCFLNETLAARHSASYVPAVARAELVRRESTAAIAAVERALGQVVEDLTPKPLSVPPIASYLIQKARGDPKGIIQEAIALREKTADVRAWLGRRLRSSERDYSKYVHELLSSTEALRDLVRRELRLDKRALLTDGIELQLVLGVPTASLSASVLRTWVKSRVSHGRIAILTDVSKVAAYPADPFALQKLRSKCLEAAS